MLKQRVATIARIKGLRVILSAVLALGVGCASRQAQNYPDPTFVEQVRPASGDTARVLRNASYYKLMGRPELALKELEEAHQLNPDNLKLVNVLAEQYEQLGRSERAQQIYLEALSRFADDQILNNNLCFSYYQAGNWQQAEACFKKVLARQPSNTAARNNLGLLLCRQGRPEEARQLWQEAEGAAAADQKLSQVLASLATTTPQPAQATAALNRPPTPITGKQAAAAPVAAARPAGDRERGPTQAALNSPRQPATAAGASGALAVPKQPDASPQAAAPASGKPAGLVAPTQAQAAPLREPVASGQTPAKPPASGANPAAGTALKPEPAISPATRGTPDSAAKDRKAEPDQATARKAAPAGTQEKPALAGDHLTAAELLQTGIEVSNGDGTPDLAREVRHRLDLEGFTVVGITNHPDYGVDRTVIYYRPGAEKVARALNAKFFQSAEVKDGKELPANTDVKIILGHDLARRQAGAGEPKKEKTL